MGSGEQGGVFLIAGPACLQLLLRIGKLLLTGGIFRAALFQCLLPGLILLLPVGQSLGPGLQLQLPGFIVLFALGQSGKTVVVRALVFL